MPTEEDSWSKEFKLGGVAHLLLKGKSWRKILTKNLNPEKKNILKLPPG
jgi:hypothetical protein